jgi:hypothetical protein
LTNANPSKLWSIGLSSLKRAVEFCVHHIEHLTLTEHTLKLLHGKTESVSIFVEAALYHQGQLLAPSVCTSSLLFCSHPIWHQFLLFDITLGRLPRV